MFESLSEKLEGALKTVSGQGRITELNIAQTMREIRRALLDADVNYQVARDFTDREREEPSRTWRALAADARKRAIAEMDR